MAIETAADVPVGTKVMVESHEHAFGKCFLHGEGMVVENVDFMSRFKGEVKVWFPSVEVTGILTPAHYASITVM